MTKVRIGKLEKSKRADEVVFEIPKQRKTVNLEATPIQGTLVVNGGYYVEGVDFVVSGKTVTFAKDFKDL
jgi:hypothetical protein